ncbi:MAG: hypothetical protein ACRC0V_05240, partial [Fusobacteriaceae bacterium]
TLDFGKVMLNKTSNKTTTLTVTGETGMNVLLSTSGPTLVTTEIKKDETLVSGATELGAGENTFTLNLAYTPIKVEDDLSATLTVTATYTD